MVQTRHLRLERAGQPTWGHKTTRSKPSPSLGSDVLTASMDGEAICLHSAQPGLPAQDLHLITRVPHHLKARSPTHPPWLQRPANWAALRVGGTELLSLSLPQEGTQAESGSAQSHATFCLQPHVPLGWHCHCWRGLWRASPNLRSLRGAKLSAAHGLPGVADSGTHVASLQQPGHSVERGPCHHPSVSVPA